MYISSFGTQQWRYPDLALGEGLTPGLSLIRLILIYRYTFQNVDISIRILKYQYIRLKHF